MNSYVFVSKLKRYFTDSDYRFLVNAAKVNHLPFMDDEEYLKRMYKAKFGTDLNLHIPTTFNEKLQWLKLHDRNPAYIQMVDKYEVKKYVAEKIGEKYVIPTLGVWNSFDEIDFSALPDQFVLKCTHDSGGLVICLDKNKFDKQFARKKINKSLERNYYWIGREWPYKNVIPRVIAEPYLCDESGIQLKDYKIHNFDGEPKIIQVDFDRFINHKRNLYTTDWKYIDLRIKYPTDSGHNIICPHVLREMLSLSRKLSANIPYIRTDFYIISNSIFFGELTFYHGSGFEEFDPPEWDHTLGSWIKLPINNN